MMVKYFMMITLFAPATTGATTMKEVIKEVAKEEQVDARLLSAICFVESSHMPHKINHMDGNSDSLGLCQIKFKTAKWMKFKGTQRELMQPKVNARFAAKYLKYQLNRYNGNIMKAVAAYNAGHYKEHKNCQYTFKVFQAYVEKR
jgi:soluble lytic murein transglycosylase-like protein